MSGKYLNLTLHVWRQKNGDVRGEFKTYPAKNISPDMSFLEMMDVVNEGLLESGEEPVAFDHDCREGICGMCSMMINGQAHGPKRGTTTCQLHMRSFKDGDEIWIEPWRASGFPIIKDLSVNRSAFDRIIQSGGYVSVRTGAAQDANALPIPKPNADRAMDAAACIGCGACVAACPNASASLFTSAKITHLAMLPQGQPERYRRVKRMVDQMDKEGFGSCTLHGECETSCPKGISIANIAQMNRDYIKAMVVEEEEVQRAGGD